MSAGPIITTIAEIGSFLLEHADTIVAIKEAIGSGASKEDVLRAIRSSMVAASDALMDQELGPITVRR